MSRICARGCAFVPSTMSAYVQPGIKGHYAVLSLGRTLNIERLSSSNPFVSLYSYIGLFCDLNFPRPTFKK